MVDEHREDTKPCTKCGEIKPLREFSKRGHGFRAHCKVCCSEYAKKYRAHGPQGRILLNDLSAEKRTCSDCGEIRPLSDFRKRSDRKNHYYTICNGCYYAYRSRYARSHKEMLSAQYKRKRENLKKDPIRYARYRAKQRQKQKILTQEMYVAVLESQGRVCAICGQPETAKNQRGEIRSLAIDHDHVTGEVRGLLCFRCNTNLALLENENFISAAQAYLSRHS